MSEDIELGNINSNERTPLLRGGFPREHSGHGFERVSTARNTPRAIGASGVHLETFAGQAGKGIGELIGQSLDKQKNRQLDEAAIYFEERDHQNILGATQIKPADLPWTEENIRLYPEHWHLDGSQYNWKPEPLVNTLDHKSDPYYNIPKQSGLVLPFSNNIGPQNTITESKNNADTVAQGHDLHYQEAKSEQDILDADKEGISHFVYTALTDNNPISSYQAAIGAIGLGLKTSVERQLGKVIYGKHA